MRVLVCLAVCAAVAQATIVDPRGARPVEHGTRSEKCATEKEWPFCTSDDWGSKCPSGCRIQGLMDKYDHSLLRKIEKIRSLLEQNTVKHRSTDQVSKQTYDYLKEKLVTDAGSDNNYYDLAQSLRTRITDMKIRIDRQLRVLGVLKDQVKDQVEEMQRLEVDIDIKLRSCKGSCKTSTDYTVDHESYEALEKQMVQLGSRSPQESVGSLYVMKSRPLKDVLVSSVYKSKDMAAQLKEDMFPEVKTMKLILEEEGSSSSPATISKVPGTSYSPSSSSSSSPSSSSSSSSSPSKSITELGGGGGGGGDGGLFGFGGDFGQPAASHVSTKSTACSKTIRKSVVHTKDGPVERMEEVMEGGPECQGLTDLTKGGIASLFPGLSHTASSSSSSSSSSSITKSVHAGGSKGDPFGGDFGFDFGGFLTDRGEEDVPDFHARSVKTARVERKADYVGTDCVAAHQNHVNGETNGLFEIRPAGAASAEVVRVYCRQEGLMGGWLLAQQRDGGALRFNRTWRDYRDGFGSVGADSRGDFWLGNQNLHLLTSQGETMLRVEMEDWEGGVATAEYTVRVGAEEEGFPLHVSGYTGDAGDALRGSDPYGSHDGMRFSTFDRDNDKWEENCAEVFGGGWWYNNCQSANLNGIYYKGTYDPEKNEPYEVENGVVWGTYKPLNYSLKTVRMFIRPAAF